MSPVARRTDGPRSAAGLYLVRLHAGSETASLKLLAID